VFNLVYETNVASCRIWDALGFKKIGRVKGCGHLKSYDYPVDALIYGRELGLSNFDELASEERFDKIKYYLKHQKYPEGADRAEKSRLRSAATSYRLVIESRDDGSEPEEKLFLKDKEVISDPKKQYDIAREVHLINHGGINKTTAGITEKYHWMRIKDTATLVIKNCPQCLDPVKNNTSIVTPNPSLINSATLGEPSNSYQNAVPPSFLTVPSSFIDGGIDFELSMTDNSPQLEVPIDPSLIDLNNHEDFR
jgi:His(2)-Cys(2) zinc finger protein